MTLAVNIAQIGSNNTTFRNRIINGAMVIDQRNAGASVTPAAGAYLTDRFQYDGSQASKFTAQQNAGSVTPPAGFRNYLGFTVASAVSITSSDYFQFVQKVEGFNMADLAWGTASAAPVTLSFWIRSSLTGTFGGSLRNGDADRSYPYTYTISAANTWEQKTITIAGDTTGTWATTNGVGIIVAWGLGNGSNFTGTAGAWAAANYQNATGATSVVGTSGATFYITGVQLEAGTTASPFEYRSYGTEAILCYRYYWQWSNSGLGDNTYFKSPYVSSAPNSSAYSEMYFPVVMRAAPTLVGVINSGSINRQTSTTNMGVWQISSSSGATAYAITSFTATAEL